MKACSFSIVQTSMVALLMTISASAFSQKLYTWKGGTPGQENNWECPKNWLPNMVPNEFSDVIIPDVSTTTQAPPVIYAGSMEVNSLFIYSNAALTIENDAHLIVYEKTTGITNLNIKGKGALHLMHDLSNTTASAEPRRQ